MKNKVFIVIASALALSSTAGYASEIVARLGLGTTFPNLNSIVSHLTPIAVELAWQNDWPVAPSFEASYASGSHGDTEIGSSDNFSISSKWIKVGVGAFYSHPFEHVTLRGGAHVGLWHASTTATLSSGTSGDNYPGSDAPFTKNNFYISPAVGADFALGAGFGYFIRFDYMTTIRDSTTSGSSFYTGDSFTLLNGLSYRL